MANHKTSNPFTRLDELYPNATKSKYHQRTAPSDREANRAAKVAEIAASCESAELAESLFSSLALQGYDLSEAVFSFIEANGRPFAPKSAAELCAHWRPSDPNANPGGIKALAKLGVDFSVPAKASTPSLSPMQQAALNNNLDALHAMSHTLPDERMGLLRSGGNALRSPIALALCERENDLGYPIAESYDQARARARTKIAQLFDSALAQLAHLQASDPKAAQASMAALAASCAFSEQFNSHSGHASGPDTAAALIAAPEAWRSDLDSTDCKPKSYGGNIFNTNSAGRRAVSSACMLVCALWGKCDEKKAVRLESRFPKIAFEADPRSGAAACLGIADRIRSCATGHSTAELLCQEALKALQRAQQINMAFGACQLIPNQGLYETHRFNQERAMESRRLMKLESEACAHPSAMLLAHMLLSPSIAQSNKPRAQDGTPPKKPADKKTKSDLSPLAETCQEAFLLSGADSYAAYPKSFERGARSAALSAIEALPFREDIHLSNFALSLQCLEAFSALGEPQKALARACLEGAGSALALAIAHKHSTASERAIAEKAAKALRESALSQGDPKLAKLLDQTLLPALHKAHPNDAKIFAAMEALTLAKAAKSKPAKPNKKTARL